MKDVMVKCKPAAHNANRDAAGASVYLIADYPDFARSHLVWQGQGKGWTMMIFLGAVGG